MKTNLPAANQRIKDVVDHYANGNVSKFIRQLKTDAVSENITQQKLNRLFNVDPKINRYPGVPEYFTDVILKTFPEISRAWLIAGEGSMIESMEEDYNVGEAIRKVEATAEVMLSAVAEILARVSNRTAKSVQDELEDLVNKRLSAS